ncbi:hypothetical protein [Streptomyces sp. CB01881]|uniref:hypothetical protein n=1 Tax=Streptomyces sp. CB01881 TaxID=2078691 RepID=UPI000CDC3FFF|nr:hypothetical protein [Streptomyces sp. CB01881]AUY52281.1 hypothetical protein C2142_28915 [Streptomyces sp. CB01881]TYC71703.1 hypothetical protein EH183_28895 [Streptomyces sp. CB01881]
MGALWVLLLVGLLTALPCAGQAQAVTADRSGPPAAGPSTTLAGPLAGPSTDLPGPPVAPGAPKAAHPSRHADGPRHWTWCSADGEPPHRDNGCSGHPYSGQDAQLPNPPPQPQPAVTPRPDTPEALPRVVARGLLDGPRPAPDLHELQVHRS